MTEGAFGSISMRPIVHTVRGPAISGKRSWMRVASRTIATPASLRRTMRVVPAWFCSPVSDDPVVPDADDRLDDADAQPAGVERVALLDMRFEIADITPGIDPLARSPAKPARCSASRSGVPSSRPRVRSISLFGKRIGERAAAEKVAVMAFLVRPGGDLDAELGSSSDPRQRRGRARARRSPRASRRASRHRAGSRCASRPAAAARPSGLRPITLPMPSITGSSPASREFLGEPMPRLDIDRRIGRPVDPGLVAAEIRRAA